MPTSGTVSNGSSVARARRFVLELVDVLPGARRTLSEIARVEVIDRSLIIAAQALFSVTPLLVVVASFAPESMGLSLVDRVSDVMGLDAEDNEVIDAAATVDNVRAQTGVAGIFLVVVSALSFARAFQRLYERVWERPHLGGIPGVRRCLFWLISWTLYMQLIAWIVGSIDGSSFTWIRFIAQVAVGTGVWWWTAHTLLLGRVEWSSLWLGALLTSAALNVMAQLSPVFMPAYVDANVAQFGGIGLMLAVSTWLLIFGGVIVFASILGRILIEEPRLRLSALKSWRAHGKGKPRKVTSPGRHKVAE